MAMWASIRDRHDYERINEKLDSIAEMKGIVLPKPVLEKENSCMGYLPSKYPLPAHFALCDYPGWPDSL
jgi:hypothetical protein